MDLTDDLRRFANKRREHVSFFDGPDKRSKERGIAREFLQQLERQFGISWRLPESDDLPASIPHDPPDVVVLGPDGELIGLELVEVVIQEAIEAQVRASARRSQGERWTPDDRAYMAISLECGTDAALQALDEQVRKKEVAAASYQGQVFSMYVLLVHCAEPWLDRAQLAGALGRHDWPPTTGIGEAYLLLDYHPQEGYPLFHLFERDEEQRRL